MTDKLTASVESKHTTHCVRLKIGERNLDVGMVWQHDYQPSAQRAADQVTKAIEKHDKFVNAELIAQRNRLLEACQWAQKLLNSDLAGQACVTLKAALAEVEKSDA